MNIVVLFYNIGGYHAARLRAAYAAAQERGWLLSAIQVTDSAHEHPWGEVNHAITFPLQTLLPAAKVELGDRGPDSTLSAERLPEVLASVQPDIIVIPGWGFPVSRAALRWCQDNQKPAILMSESKHDDERRVWWKEFLKSWLYVRKFSAALVGADAHRHYLTQLGLPKSSIFLGYDVVDNDYFATQAQVARQDPDDARQRQPAIPNRPYFLTVTRFIPRKNVKRLLHAYAEYRQQQGGTEPWDLVLCGSGVEEPELRQIIAEQQLEHCVHLPGFISYQAIADWYGLAHALIHPALQEQWGLVVNEAMAAGLPVLVSDCCGCYPELVRYGVNGFGFDPTDQEQLTRLMVTIASNAIDLSQMGRASQEQIQQFSPHHFGVGLMQAIQHSIARRA